MHIIGAESAWRQHLHSSQWKWVE